MTEDTHVLIGGACGGLFALGIVLALTASPWWLALTAFASVGFLANLRSMDAPRQRDARYGIADTRTRSPRYQRRETP